MAENETKPTGERRRLHRLHGADGAKQRSLLSKLGKHRMGKVCLYFRQLADLDKSALKKLVVGSIADMRRRYG